MKTLLKMIIIALAIWIFLGVISSCDTRTDCQSNKKITGPIKKSEQYSWLELKEKEQKVRQLLNNVGKDVLCIERSD